MLDSQLLLAAGFRCVHFTSDHADGLADLLERGFVVRHVTSPLLSEDDLLRQVGRALDFPSYYGANWDAAEECLRDLEWLPANGYLLVIRGAERFWMANPECAGRMVEVWLASAEEWAKTKIPFHLVFCW